MNKDLSNTLSQKFVLGERSSTKAPVTLTKDDFKRIYELNNSNSFSVMREKSIERSEKLGIKSKITLDRLPDQII